MKQDANHSAGVAWAGGAAWWLVEDYLRRKAWIFAAGGLLELLLGWFGGHVGGKTRDLWMFQFQVGIFVGAFLLSFDLQKGLARVAVSLPATARQIGRAYWLVAVLIPTVVFTGLLWLGAMVFMVLHPAAEFDGVNVALASLFLFMLLGSTFTVVLAATPGLSGGGMGPLISSGCGIIWGLLVGSGFFMINGGTVSPARLCVVMAIGLAMAVPGFLLAGRCVASRAAFRGPAQTVLARARPVGLPTKVLAGYGGLPRLLAASFGRAFFLGAAMMLMSVAIFRGMGGGMFAWWEVLKYFPGLGMVSFWFVMIFSVAPVLVQMRLLRSLPVSATVLAVTLMGVLGLPLIALEALCALIAGLAAGPAAAMTIVDSGLLVLPSMALSVVLLAWLGTGMWTYLAMFMVMVLSQIIPVGLQIWLHRSDVPAALSLSIAAGLLCLGLWLTRRSLQRGNGLYRARNNTFGNLSEVGR